MFVKLEDLLNNLELSDTNEVRVNLTTLGWIVGQMTILFWTGGNSISINLIEWTTVDICNSVGQIVGEGDVSFKFGRKEVIQIWKHKLEFEENLISLSKILQYFKCELKHGTYFKGRKIVCKISGDLLHERDLENGLYLLPNPIFVHQNVSLLSFYNKSTVDWHRIFVLVGKDRILNQS